MKPLEDFVQIVNRKRYSTRTATLLAGNDYWDGHNFERHGRNSFLFRSPRGAYFVLHQTTWQGEHTGIRPLTTDEAADLWERLPERRVDFEDAFLGMTLEDA